MTWHRFKDDQPPDFISSLWAFPIVGLVIGAAGGGVLAAGQALALPSFAVAICGLAAMILLSGARHEDGLADMADGFGGGRTTEAKIRIMHDSRIGTYGVLGLVLTVAIRLGLYMTCLDMFSGWSLVLFIAVIQAAGRLQPVVQLSAFRISPCEPGPIDRSAQRNSACRRGVICLAPMVWLLGPITTASMIIPALALAIWLGQLATRQVGGLTGDVMGATVILTEIIMLMCWASVAAWFRHERASRNKRYLLRQACACHQGPGMCRRQTRRYRSSITGLNR